ncbi:MAG: cell division protein ZapB [Deltaproteobacteria bacterium]|nr:cell division protein ZapB [Deltaproteobacteria bacterium]
MEGFEILEERIGWLIERHGVLKGENKRLAEEIDELKDKLKRMTREKGLVKEKVEGLLGRIDGLLEKA